MSYMAIPSSSTSITYYLLFIYLLQFTNDEQLKEFNKHK